jgi:hypothetical protein
MYPTTEEIFRGRFIEEPLVPVGREPTVAETTALAGIQETGSCAFAVLGHLVATPTRYVPS